MSAKGEVQREGAVRFERLVPGPIERVWAHLTESALLAAWYGEGAHLIEPREGGAVNLMDGHIRGVVTQWRPPILLSHTWNVLDPGETVSSYPESYLSWSLEARGDDVLLVLTHRPIPPEFEGRTMMGWHTFMDAIACVLRGEQPLARKEAMQRNAKLYDVDLEALMAEKEQKQ